MNIKLYYFNFRTWRAEALRAGLFLQNIPFEDIRTREQLEEIKPRSPFGAFPIMEIDGTILSQTQALCTYVGKLGSVYDYSSIEASRDEAYPRLYPVDDDIFAQAKCDEIINGCTEVTTTIASTMRLPKDEVEAKRKALIQPDGGRLYMHCSGLESIVCAGAPGVACGKSLTVADLCIWRLVAWMSGGILDHIPSDFVSANFPNLQAIYEACEANEKIAEYVKQYYK